MPSDGSCAVSPQRLIDDFSSRADPTQRGVRALTAAIRRTGYSRSGSAEESLQQWVALFRKTCGQDWPRPKARLDRLARHYGVAHDPARPEIVLFALQSWYVLLVKLFVGHVLGGGPARGSRVGGRKSAAAAVLEGDVREVIDSLAQGRIFSALAVSDPWAGEPFGWFAQVWSAEWEQAVSGVAARIAAYAPDAVIAYAAAGGDLLKPLYESLFPRAVRHALGEYYTPDWLAEHVLDQVGYAGQRDVRLLDPTCGSGTFLLAAIRRWRHHANAETRGRGYAGTQKEFPFFGPPIGLPMSSIAGFDLHPLAVATARANYLLAIADLITTEDFVEVPVFARDAILDPWTNAPAFDFVVGNPPWIAWDNLPGDYREATKPYWQRYGLFSLSGNDARHGGGKKDLSTLVLYASADRYLRDGGRLGMVITQTLFQSKGAGDGFRRFQIGAAGAPLRVLRVDDLVDVRPFADAANWTSVVSMQKGEPTTYPLPYVKWSFERRAMSNEPGAQSSKLIAHSSLLARPIDPQRPTSPWIVYSAESAVDCGRTVGPAEYAAHLGANSGGANAVYWLEVEGRAGQGVRVRNRVAKAKRIVDCVEAVIEPDLLYPLIRWADVNRWSARPSGHLLLAQDPVTRAGLDEDRMRHNYPRTFAYLKQFEPLLTARAAYRRYQDRQPFYSMYNVGPYTVAAAKVIWRRMDRKIRAAVVETVDDPCLGKRPVVPQETCVLIACECGDEAHYLCALMNSSLVHELVCSHSVAGGKGFGTPSILDYLPLRKFNPDELRHRELAALSRRLHEKVAMDATEGCEAGEVDRLAELVICNSGEWLVGSG